MELHERLRLARERRFATAKEAATYLGVPQPTFAHHEKGTRGIKPGELERYAKAFKVSPEWLMFGTGDAPTDSAKSRQPASVPEFLEIKGEVAAGIWAEVDGDAFEPVTSDIPPDPLFQTKGQFLLKVRGTSINRKASPGSLVRCLDAFAAPREPKEGDWVIVRRQRGDTFETTVKQLRMVDGRPMLFPDSTDERYQEPIPVGPHDGEEVLVAAFVLDFINPATRF
jgi:SOS-response transcriptional repressor LexA